ncbi:hypothetical protein TIFTF001_032692 [Ficus carica]|uniref:Uncharacterized protein n=1 Tax=Ficus carica TaxID=3494 RepID=A0AA88DYZ1_FICCA|nr:hypothetical protein TIFTF001_032692 [Ficus carica]
MDILTFNRLDVESVVVSSDIDAMLKDKSPLTDDEFINDLDVDDKDIDVWTNCYMASSAGGTEPPSAAAPKIKGWRKAKLLDVTRKDWFKFDLDANGGLIWSIIYRDSAKCYKDWKNDLYNYFKDIGGADNEEYVGTTSVTNSKNRDDHKWKSLHGRISYAYHRNKKSNTQIQQPQSKIDNWGGRHSSVGPRYMSRAYDGSRPYTSVEDRPRRFFILGIPVGVLVIGATSAGVSITRTWPLMDPLPPQADDDAADDDDETTNLVRIGTTTITFFPMRFARGAAASEYYKWYDHKGHENHTEQEHHASRTNLK